MSDDYQSSPFGRALRARPGESAPRGEYWSVAGHNRWSGRLTTVLNYRTEEDARAAVRELRRDYGHDERWSKPSGPYFFLLKS